MTDSWTEILKIITINTLGVALQYLLLAGLAWWLCYRIWRQRFSLRKIIPTFPTDRQIRREIGYSLCTAFIFSLAVLATWGCASLGWNRFYWQISAHGVGWLVGSLALTLVLWDAWFYWTHRAMHHPKLFRVFHRTHHLSHNPSPWTTYAVDPPEAAVYAAFIPLVAFIYPLHPSVVVVFMTIQFCCNLAIHTGYEFMPARFSGSRLAQFISSPTSHVQHHETGRGNFGFCFQFWDRLMGTCHPDYDARLHGTTHAGQPIPLEHTSPAAAPSHRQRS